MAINQQRAFRAIVIVVLTLATTASIGTLTTWPTDGSVEVTGNYGMTERGGSGDWIHHSEIDVNGKPDTTIARAVRDGWICYIDIGGTATDDSILGFEIACLLDTLYYSYHHIRPLDPADPNYVDMKSVRYDSVATWIAVTESQPLGYIRSPDDTLNTVSHPHVAFAASYLLAHVDTLVQYTRNPLVEYGNLDPSSSDGDDLPDIHQIMFHAVPDLPGQQFFPDSIPIYGPVDVVAEITDDQGHIPYQGTLEHSGRTYFRGITSVPLTVGYWIDGPTSDVLDPGPDGPFLYLMDFSTWQGRGDTILAIYDEARMGFDMNPDPVYTAYRCYGSELTHTNRDSTRHWFTNHLSGGGDADTAYQNSDAEFPDGTYRVHVIAKDLQGEREDSLDVQVNNFPPHARTVELRNIWPGGSGPDTTAIRKAGWVDHPTDPLKRQLSVETQRWMTLDTLEIVVQFDQTQDRDSIDVRTSYMVPGGPSLWFNEVRWDSTLSLDDTWVGRCDVVITSGMRDIYPGRWMLTIKSADLAGNSIDTNPETKAYRDSLGSFVGYEQGQADSTHFWWLQPWFDVNIAGDVSQSVMLGWNAQGMYVADRILELAQMEHSDRSRADLWRGSVWRYFGSTTANEEKGSGLKDWPFEPKPIDRFVFVAGSAYRGPRETRFPHAESEKRES